MNTNGCVRTQGNRDAWPGVSMGWLAVVREMAGSRSSPLPRVMRLLRAHDGLGGGALPMSRSVVVCLCAIVALVGAPLVHQAMVRAASGTLRMETPLQDSPDPAAAVIALLPEGAVVSIDGPPVDGFYPVTAGDLSGWMRGETLSVEKDIVAEGSEVLPPPAESDGLAPAEQAVDGIAAPVGTPATV